MKTPILLVFLSILAPSLYSAPAPPLYANPWSTNRPPIPVTGHNDLIISNAAWAEWWEFIQNGPRSVARLKDITNVVNNAITPTNGITGGQATNLIWMEMHNVNYGGVFANGPALDNTIAMQALLDRGGWWYFPSSTNYYRFTGTLRITNSGTTLIGWTLGNSFGGEMSWLKWDDVFDGTAIDVYQPDPGVDLHTYGPGFHNLRVQTGGSNTNFFLTDVYDADFSGCRIEGKDAHTGAGIYAHSSGWLPAWGTGIKIDKCFIINFKNDILFDQLSTYTVLSRTWVLGAEVGVNNANECQIQNSALEGLGIGFIAPSASTIRVHGTRIESVATNFVARNGSYIDFSGNECHGTFPMVLEGNASSRAYIQNALGPSTNRITDKLITTSFFLPDPGFEVYDMTSGFFPLVKISSLRAGESNAWDQAMPSYGAQYAGRGYFDFGSLLPGFPARLHGELWMHNDLHMISNNAYISIVDSGAWRSHDDSGVHAFYTTNSDIAPLFMQMKTNSVRWFSQSNIVDFTIQPGSGRIIFNGVTNNPEFIFVGPTSQVSLASYSNNWIEAYQWVRAGSGGFIAPKFLGGDFIGNSVTSSMVWVTNFTAAGYKTNLYVEMQTPMATIGRGYFVGDPVGKAGWVADGDYGGYMEADGVVEAAFNWVVTGPDQALSNRTMRLISRTNYIALERIDTATLTLLGRPVTIQDAAPTDSMVIQADGGVTFGGLIVPYGAIQIPNFGASPGFVWQCTNVNGMGHWTDSSGIFTNVSVGVTNAVASVFLDGSPLVPTGCTNINIISSTYIKYNTTNTGQNADIQVYFDATAYGAVVDGKITAASNNLYSSIIANGSTVSNGCIGAVMTASNTLWGAFVANDTTTSNGAIAALASTFNQLSNRIDPLAQYAPTNGGSPGQLWTATASGGHWSNAPAGTGITSNYTTLDSGSITVGRSFNNTNNSGVLNVTNTSTLSTVVLGGQMLDSTGNPILSWDALFANSFLFNAMTNQVGSENLAIGNGAMWRQFGNNYDFKSVALGEWAMNEVSGSYDVAVGAYAMAMNAGDYRTNANDIAIGYYAMGRSSMSNSIAIGVYALKDSAYGIYNIAIGESALDTSPGRNNVAIGIHAGYSITGGNSNIYLGSYSGPSGTSAEYNQVYIGGVPDRPVVKGDGIKHTVMVDSQAGLLVTPLKIIRPLPGWIVKSTMLD